MSYIIDYWKNQYEKLKENIYFSKKLKSLEEGKAYRLFIETKKKVSELDRKKIIEKIEQSDKIKVLNIVEKDNELIIDIEVLRNPLPLTLLIVVLAGALTSYFISVSLKDVKEISKSTWGKFFLLSVLFIAGLLTWRLL